MQQNRVTCWHPGAGRELGDARGGRKGDWTGPTRVCRAVMNGKTGHGHGLVNGRCEMACNCTQDYHRPGNCPVGSHPCRLPSGVSEGERDSEISVPKGLASMDWLLLAGLHPSSMPQSLCLAGFGLRVAVEFVFVLEILSLLLDKPGSTVSASPSRRLPA